MICLRSAGMVIKPESSISRAGAFEHQRGELPVGKYPVFSPRNCSSLFFPTKVRVQIAQIAIPIPRVRSAGSDFDHSPDLTHIETRCSSDPIGHPRGLMNVSAVKPERLVPLDPLAQRRTSAMLAWRVAVEQRVERRYVYRQIKFLERVELA